MMIKFFKNSKKYKAIIAGHLCLDIFPCFLVSKDKPINEIFSPGKLTLIKDAELSVGGAVNTGLVLKHLGISNMLMGKIGNDYFGRVLCEIIAY
jgi:sugar/nucleoside kinase (ribokinase family)